MRGGSAGTGVGDTGGRSARLAGASFGAARPANFRTNCQAAESANGAADRDAAKSTNGETGSGPNGEAGFRSKGASGAAANDTARLSAPYVERRADHR